MGNMPQHPICLTQGKGLATFSSNNKKTIVATKTMIEPRSGRQRIAIVFFLGILHAELLTLKV